MTEQQRVVWSLAMPACAEVNRVMQELAGVSFNSGEQNKDMAKSRQARDWKDIQTLLSYLQERSPFSSDPILRNICTGVHAHSTVNVDTAIPYSWEVVSHPRTACKKRMFWHNSGPSCSLTLLISHTLGFFAVFFGSGQKKVL